MQTRTWLHRLKGNKRGVSTVITVVLSLVIVVVIVANVVLWSYDMNRYDLERTQENLDFAVVTHSSWLSVQSEYKINSGNITGGSYLDTQTDDGGYETFREDNLIGLDINGTYIIDLTALPLAYIQGIEILLKFQASDTGEAWLLKAYNWTTNSYSNNGFNRTLFTPTTTTGWNYYEVSITTGWMSYLQSDKGKMLIQFSDNNADSTQTTIRIDSLVVRAVTRLFSFRNNGPDTSHIVALWVTNSTQHNRYTANFYVNSGMNALFFREDVILPKGRYVAKAVTERGNTFVHS